LPLQLADVDFLRTKAPANLNKYVPPVRQLLHPTLKLLKHPVLVVQVTLFNGCQSVLTERRPVCTLLCNQNEKNQHLFRTFKRTDRGSEGAIIENIL